MHDTFTRIAGVAGLVFIAALLAVNVAIGASGKPLTPDLAAIQAWFEANASVTLLTAALAPIIWIALPIFAVGVLRATTNVGSWNPWAILGIIAVAMQNAVFSGVIITDTILALRIDAFTEQPTVTLAFWDFHNAAMNLNHVSIALALGGFSMAVLTAKRMPTWFGATGLLGAAALLFSGISMTAAVEGNPTPVMFVGLLIWIAWVSTFAVTLVRAKTATTAPVVAPA